MTAPPPLAFHDPAEPVTVVVVVVVVIVVVMMVAARKFAFL